MKLCLSTYMSTLIKYKAVSTTQSELFNTIVLLFNLTWRDGYSDVAITELVNGKKNISLEDIGKIKATDKDSIVFHFREKVLPLLDNNKRREIVDDLICVLKLDDTITPDTEVDLINGFTKKELLTAKSYKISTLLAGLFLYVVIYTDNKGTNVYAKQVKAGLLAKSEERRSYILLPEKEKNIRSKTIWSYGGSVCKIIPGDLLDIESEFEKPHKKIVVIPVNTTFETTITRNIERELYPLVSEETIHGKWLLKMQEAGIQKEELDKRIEESLLRQKTFPDSKSQSPIGKEESYPVGSIAILEVDNIIYYLSAISVFDQKSISHTTKDNLKEALHKLFESYDRFGQGYDLYMPLIGTGRSRANLILKDSLNMIKASLSDNCNLIHGNIFIVIKDERYDILI